MGTITQFSRPHRSTGTVHIWRCREGGYEIGHESRSGSSWGYFSEHPTALHALVAACRLNMETLEARAEIVISDDVIGDLEVGHDRREARRG